VHNNNLNNNHLTKAAALLVFSLWILSGLDSTGKWLLQAGVSLAVLIWVRYTVHALLMSVYAVTQRKTLRLSVQSKTMHTVRGLLMVGSTVLFFKTLSIMPLAEATAINFIAPLITLTLAPLLLNEKTRWYRWAGVGVALCGVLLVLRPGFQNSAGMGWALSTAAAFSLYQMATRWVAKDDPIVTNLWGGWVGTVTSSIAMIWLWTPPQLSILGWALLVSTGITGLVGHILQVSAYRHAPANALAPFSYFQIVSALGLGYLVFGQLPDWISFAGMALICISGVSVALLDRRQQATDTSK
jgi:drug/metabolite transporter (DMT)-like permease